MKPIREKWIIQIEVTNACAHECTNCSRFVGHYKVPYFMDLGMVKEAIESLEGFPGGVGIMGGEPTLHPRFTEICQLMRKLLPPDKRFLWTSGYQWDKYRKIIAATFGQNVQYNDHSDASQKHHPMLLGISDVIDDPDFIERSVADCWVDQRWSASINPKGCFFCEVAAAMDLLFDGPGGLPIEKGWWRKGPEAFLDQRRRYCYQCGANVAFSPVTLGDKLDVVSESNYQRLVKASSPKLQKGRVQLVRYTFAERELARVAQNWEPWNHLGVMEHEGTGKNYSQMYGPLRGGMLKIKRQLQIRSRNFRRLEFVTGRLLWKLGLR